MPRHPVNGAAIRATRSDKGLSVAQLAAAAQVSIDYLYRIESPPCSEQALSRIAAALDVDPDSLRVTPPRPRSSGTRARRPRRDSAQADTEQVA